MQNVKFKLRLDYFLSLGLKLAEGDRVITIDGGAHKTNVCTIEQWNAGTDEDHMCFVESFTTRKNKDAQPCGETPIIATAPRLYSKKGLAKNFEWGGVGAFVVCAWKPDINELIKMQIEHDRKLALTAECEKITATEGEKQITLADLKPKKTKVEFVKVDKNAENGKYWECARQFAEGECEFFTDGNENFLVANNDCLLANYKSGLLYRKVETEITWQNELRDFLFKSATLSPNEFSDFFDNDESTCVVKEFIEMCHLVASMTDKPE